MEEVFDKAIKQNFVSSNFSTKISYTWHWQLALVGFTSTLIIVFDAYIALWWFFGKKDS